MKIRPRLTGDSVTVVTCHVLIRDSGIMEPVIDFMVTGMYLRIDRKNTPLTVMKPKLFGRSCGLIMEPMEPWFVLPVAIWPSKQEKF